MTLLCGSIFGLFVLRNLLLCGGNLWKSATFSVAPGFWGSFARLDFLVAAHKGLLLSSRNTDPPCTMANSMKYCPKLQKSFYYKRKYLQYKPSITDGVHRNENLVEIIPVFSTFSNFFKKKKKMIKAILCNFSMRLLKYF